MGSCTKHDDKVAERDCRRCGAGWCLECLVFTYGPDKPPFCMSCAMVAAGVRTAGARPAMTKRMARAQRKAEKVRAKAEAKAARAGGDSTDDGADDGDPSGGGGSGIDWSAPWWEEPKGSVTVD